jgi:hypothetical protein
VATEASDACDDDDCADDDVFMYFCWIDVAYDGGAV